MMETTRPRRATEAAEDHATLRGRVTEVMPRDRAELARWVRIALGVEVTDGTILEGSSSPLDYLEWSFFGAVAGKDGNAPSVSDCVVWGPRGGGKTFYAAMATLLDMVFRAGISVKVLGGSREQSERMHEHLRKFFERPALSEMVDGRITERRARLRNGSVVEVLAQSERSVRGTRPQKLRCDEVELFDEGVWSAAQLVTRSKWCGIGPRRVLVRGGVEVFSTCHRPSGLMSRLIQESQETGSRRLFRWTAVDVLERCPQERECAACPLWEECAGRAKQREGSGHLSIDDAIVLKRRSAKEAWESEMLCRRPTRRAAVFPEFNPATHVLDMDMSTVDPHGLAGPQAPKSSRPLIIGGMDFGFRSPTVVLWASLDEGDVVRVMAERVVAGALLDDHVRAIIAHSSTKPRWIGVDPAGCQRSDQTGLSPVTVMRRAGIAVRHRRTPIEEGLRVIRARLDPACGGPKLFVHPRCTHLIECLQNYRFPDDDQIASPIKDGHDHAIDALRYMLINLDSRSEGVMERY